jgi:hypothetical protein
MVLRVRRPAASKKKRGLDFKVKIFGDRAAANRDKAN